MNRSLFCKQQNLQKFSITAALAAYDICETLHQQPFGIKLNNRGKAGKFLWDEFMAFSLNGFIDIFLMIIAIPLD